MKKQNRMKRKIKQQHNIVFSEFSFFVYKFTQQLRPPSCSNFISKINEFDWLINLLRTFRKQEMCNIICRPDKNDKNDFENFARTSFGRRNVRVTWVQSEKETVLGASSKQGLNVNIIVWCITSYLRGYFHLQIKSFYFRPFNTIL